MTLVGKELNCFQKSDTNSKTGPKFVKKNIDIFNGPGKKPGILCTISHQKQVHTQKNHEFF